MVKNHKNTMVPLNEDSASSVSKNAIQQAKTQHLHQLQQIRQQMQQNQQQAQTNGSNQNNR